MPAGRTGSYSNDEYFAFVEDAEPFAAEWSEPPEDAWWHRLYLERQSLNLPRPSSLLWLDCVSAPYFDSLEWADEIISPEDATEREQRRERILQLDPQQFVIVPLLLSDDSGDAELAERFAQEPWNRVVINKDAGRRPVLAGPDYDFDDRAALRYLRFEKTCGAVENRLLRNVFNLDFLPEGRIDKESGFDPGAPTPIKPISPKVLVDYGEYAKA